MLRAAAIMCWSWHFLMLSGCVTKRKKKKFYLLTHGPLTRETISEEFRFCMTPVANLITHRWVRSLGHEYEYTHKYLLGELFEQRLINLKMSGRVTSQTDQGNNQLKHEHDVYHCCFLGTMPELDVKVDVFRAFIS